MVRPSPDFGRLRRVLLRQGEPDRVPLVELHVDPAVGGKAIGFPPAGDPLEWAIGFWYRAGYDFVEVCPPIDFPGRLGHQAQDPGFLSTGLRTWPQEHDNVIGSWADLERYPWPQPHQVDYSVYERAGKMLPEGMAIIPNTAGVFEYSSWLMGIESFCLACAEQPDLVAAVVERVGEFLVQVYETLADVPGVGALWLGDDMGSNLGTFIHPDLLRRWIFPYHRRIAQAAHRRGLPFILHSCGNLKRIIPDLVEYVGIDALHSLPANIYDIGALKRQWGDRLALIGNVDVDLLSRGTPDQVRAAVRRLLTEVAPGGGFALGSSNSIPDYVKAENYRALLEETMEHGRYPIRQ